MVETYELLRPLRDENTDITYTCAQAHIRMHPLVRVASNRAAGACKLQNHLIWEIRKTNRMIGSGLIHSSSFTTLQYFSLPALCSCLQ